MQFMAGYQLFPDDRLIQALLKHRERIYEVYFPWDDLPNGRSAFSARSDCMAFEAQARLVNDLKILSDAGIKLNLLLNGNCYGKFSQSRVLFNKIGDAIDYIRTKLGLQSVTTTSPLMAKFIRANFPELEVRASVNMAIGSVQGMDYVGEYFDGYYLKRELNRNLARICEIKTWCDGNGKKLYLLANSGCLNHCSVHNFHDNLVAHENEIKAMDNAFEFRGICHDYLRRPEKQISIVRDSSFIRPEDIHLYEPYFTAVKLATRSNRDPVTVLESYISGSYHGNVMELLEPNHAEAFYPTILENSAFPADFAAKVMQCAKKCDSCDYCRDVLERIKVNLDNIGEGLLC